jgi:hypothetical protein
MGIVSYKRLFEVNLKHTFYASGFTPDIEVTPVPETARLFTDSKVLSRKTPSGMLTLFRDAGTGPFIEIDTPVTFLFAVSFSQLANRMEFLNFTDLSIAGPIEYSREKPFLFSNGGNISTNPASPQALAYSFLNGLRPSVFAYQFPFLAGSSTETGTIDIQDSAGNSLDGFPVSNIKPNDSLQYIFSVNMIGLPGGKYSIITSDTTPNGPVTEVYYIDNTLAQRNDILGFMELTYNTANDLYNATTYFDMQFVRRNTLWKYYIVNKSGNVVLNTTSIAWPSSPPSPYPATINFGAGISGPLINGSQSWIFISDNPIPFYETSLANVSLLQGSNPLQEDLPNSTREGVVSDDNPFTSDIFVFV